MPSEPVRQRTKGAFAGHRARHPWRRRKSSACHQRQTQDGEIVAVDPLEQLNARAFHLIAADARRCAPPDGIKIKIEKRRRKTLAWSAAPYQHIRTPPSCPAPTRSPNGAHAYGRAAPKAGHAPPRDPPAWQTARFRAPRSDRRPAPAGPDARPRRRPPSGVPAMPQ